MDKFKEYIYADSIAKVIITKRPLSKMWGFPEFVRKNNKLLKELFGSLAYEVYNKQNKDDQTSMIKWFETHGVETTEMYKGELYEDWNDETIPKRDLLYLKNNHPVTYKNVVKNVVGIVYGTFSQEVQQKIIDKFIEEPETFDDEIKRNS